jgi:hypothetical protein
MPVLQHLDCLMCLQVTVENYPGDFFLLIDLVKVLKHDP